jgi:hypothetical protein
MAATSSPVTMTETTTTLVESSGKGKKDTAEVVAVTKMATPWWFKVRNRLKVLLLVAVIFVLFMAVAIALNWWAKSVKSDISITVLNSLSYACSSLAGSLLLALIVTYLFPQPVSAAIRQIQNDEIVDGSTLTFGGFR